MCPLSLLPSSPLLQDDDEWDDYRENKKDYTGLKIENLTVQETKTEEEEEETEVGQRRRVFGDPSRS